MNMNANVLFSEMKTFFLIRNNDSTAICYSQEMK